MSETCIARTGKTNTPEGFLIGLVRRDEAEGEYIWTFDSRENRDKFLKDYADGKFKKPKDLGL